MGSIVLTGEGRGRAFNASPAPNRLAPLVASGLDDIGLGVGVGLALEGDGRRIGADAILGAGSGLRDLAGDRRIHDLRVGSIMLTGEGRSRAFNASPAPNRLAVLVADGRQRFGLGIAAHRAFIGCRAVECTGRLVAQRGILRPAMVTGLGGAVHIIEVDAVICLKKVFPKRGIGLGVQHGHAAVDGEHPAGVGAVRRIAAAKTAASGVGHSGHIAAAALVGVAAGGQCRLQRVPSGLVGIALAGVGGGRQVGEVRREGAAGNIDSDGDILNGRILNASGADDGDDRAHWLLVELLELRIGRIRAELLIVLAVLDVGENAVDLDVRVVPRLGDKQRLVRDHGRNARTETAVLLGIVPAVDVVHLHARPLRLCRRADELVAIAVRNDLHEGPEIAGDEAVVRIGLPDTLPVDILGADLPHEGCGCVDVALAHCRNGDGDILAGEYLHIRIVLAGAAGAGKDLDGQRDLCVCLAGQGTVDPCAGGIGIERLHDRFIIAGDEDGGVLSVKVRTIVGGKNLAHIRGGGEVDVGDDSVYVDRVASRGNIERAEGLLLAAGQPKLQSLLIVDGLLCALDLDGVGEVDLQIVAAAVGQRSGKRYVRIRFRTADLHGVGCEELGIVIADADDRGIRGLPCDLCP